MTICDENKCTGCMMCADICYMGAIKLQANFQGFLYPLIDDNLCVGCNRCVNCCPVNNQYKHDKISTVLAVWSRDESERLSSSSGGVFMTLAMQVISENGVVYGSTIENGNSVCHRRVDTVSDLPKLRGSKYVQSYTRGVYKSVQNDLKSGIKVLFSGTPCQVSALRSYLNSDYDNLICVDVVCHGVPSSKVFDDYMNYMNSKYNSKPIAINFRYKDPCWSVFSMKIDYESGETYIASKFKDPFLHFYLVSGGGDLTLRPSCFECAFTTPERSGDITLGDFWGIRAYKKSQYNQEKGISIVLLNTNKGENLFKEVKDKLNVLKKTWQDAFISNNSFIRPWKRPNGYDEFWKDYQDLSFEEIVNKYCIYDKELEGKKLVEAKGRATAYMHPKILMKHYIKTVLRIMGIWKK